MSAKENMKGRAARKIERRISPESRKLAKIIGGVGGSLEQSGLVPGSGASSRALSVPQRFE